MPTRLMYHQSTNAATPREGRLQPICQARNGIQEQALRAASYPSRFRLRQLQAKLRDGVLVPLARPEDFHKGLFHNEEVDLNNLSAGFLQNEEPVKSYFPIFISPSSAIEESGGNKVTVKGNAAKHEILTVSLDSIIYVAHLDHFAWSSQLVYSATGGDGQFNYRLFCKTIKDTVMGWPESEVESLWEWWNESLGQIFPESTARPTPIRADGALSIAERMKMQAETARVEAEEAASARAEEIRGKARELQASTAT
ncbi:hypothetical protein B0H13DRAFT_1872472 [Mycena leptocephala]|nr:hypothetical protein B0H13DRAFT_1872472 [Mycena leptocephala]